MQIYKTHNPKNITPVAQGGAEGSARLLLTKQTDPEQLPVGHKKYLPRINGHQL